MAVRLLKILFVMASFCIGTVLASDYEVYVAKNKEGGRITLTLVDCPQEHLKGSKISVSRSENKQVYGCWILNKGTIYVVWFFGNEVYVSEYSPSMFKKELML
jgi:hypothetical protein